MYKLWDMRQQFIRYFVVGISGVILDLITLIFLKEYIHITPVVAVLINQALVLEFNYTLNRLWSFKSTGLKRKQMVRYLSLATLNYIFAAGAMYVGHDQFGFDYRLVRLASIALMVSWNFILYRNWVYRVEESGMKNEKL